MKPLDDTNKRNTIKEIIVDITTDHDSDTLEEVLDVYADKFLALMLQERIHERENMKFIDNLGNITYLPYVSYRYTGDGLLLNWDDRTQELESELAALKEHSFKEKA